MITKSKIIPSLLGLGLLLLAGLAVAPNQAEALSPQQRVVLFSGGPQPVLDFNPGATGAASPKAPSFSDSRGSTAWGFIKSGLLSSFSSNVARYVYDPSSLASLGFLSEQAHQNLVTYSSGAFSNATYWTIGKGTVVDSNVNSPLGTNTGSTYANDTTSGTHELSTPGNISVTSGTTYAMAAILKSGTDHLAQLTFNAGQFSGAGYANFDLSSGTVTATGGTLVNNGIINLGNGWYLCWISAQATSTALTTALISRISSSTDTRHPSFLGTGTTILVAQVDVIANSFPLSPVVTTGSSVNVLADNASIPLSAIGIPGSPTGITIIGKLTTAPGFSSAANQNVFQIDDGSTNNRLVLRRTGSTGNADVVIVSGGSFQTAPATPYSSWPNSTSSVFWLAVSPGNLSVQFVGQAKKTSAPSLMPTGLVTLRLGTDASTSLLNGPLSRLLIYNSRLSDAQAAAIAGRM